MIVLVLCCLLCVMCHCIVLMFILCWLQCCWLIIIRTCIHKAYWSCSMDCVGNRKLDIPRPDPQRLVHIADGFGHPLRRIGDCGPHGPAVIRLKPIPLRSGAGRTLPSLVFRFFFFVGFSFFFSCKLFSFL